jgi:predicted Zn-dependent protease
MRKMFIVLFSCIAVLLAGYVGYRGYKVWKNKRLVSLGHDFLVKSDRRNAALSVQAVLRSDPKNVDATRMMAALAEESRSPSAVLWRSRVVELNPHSLPDRLALAETAMTLRDFAAATNALAGVDPADKKTASYHNIAGMVAAAQNDFVAAEPHFIEATKLEPQNPSPQLNLAIVRLHGSNTVELLEARAALQRLASSSTNSSLRCQALRELTIDAERYQQQDAALALSKQLALEANVGPEDWILRLQVLKKANSAEFKPTLAAYHRAASTNAAKIYELARWEMAQTSPEETVSWLRSLPAPVQTNQPTTLLVAECYEASRDWSNLDAWLDKQRWAELEFIRHAMASHALEGQELRAASKTEWEQALKAANGQKQSLVMLLRLAVQWKRVNDAQDLLWTIVNRYPQEKWATHALTQDLFAGGQTRSLMQLFKQELNIAPTDLSVKNNLATVALLLDARELEPNSLAREVYQEAPTNAAYATTYAFSLYAQGKSADALKVMQSLKPQDLDRPAIAGYYGLILKAAGDGAKARAFLDWSAKAPLLPEERKLFASARSGS